MRGGPGSKNAAARGGVAQAGTVAKEVHHKAAGGGGEGSKGTAARGRCGARPPGGWGDQAAKVRQHGEARHELVRGGRWDEGTPARGAPSPGIRSKRGAGSVHLVQLP